MSPSSHSAHNPVRAKLVPPCVRDWILLAAWLALGFLALFDKVTESRRESLLSLVLAALVVLDAPAPRRWLTRRTVRRIAFCLIGVAAATLLGEVQRLLGGAGRPAFYAAWSEMIDSRSFAVLFVTMWVYSPIAAFRKRNELPSSPDSLSAPLPPWAVFASTALALLTAWSYATCLSSLDPKTSFRHFPVDAGAYAPLFIYWIRIAPGREALDRAMRRGVIAVLAVGALAAFVVLLMFWLGGETMRERVLAAQWPANGMVTLEPAAGGGETARLTFPFGHHNRLAFFSMVACLGLLGGAMSAKKWRWRVPCALGAAVALLDLLFTLNRGAIMSLGVGVALICALALRRRAWMLLLLPPLAWPLLPSAQKERIKSVFRPETYTQPEGTWWLRTRHFRTALAMISEYPVIGIGYGWKHMEDYYTQFCEEHDIPVYEAVHAHNIWLETGAESGLPAAALFLLFHVARWYALAGLLLRAKRLDPSGRRRLAFWIGLEAAMQLFCLTNYPLRRSLGLIAWGAWAIMAGDVIRIGGRATAVGEPSRAAECFR